MLKHVILSASIASLSLAPVAASAATVNPASKLSLTSTSRASAPTGKTNRATGAGVGPIAAGIIVVGIAVGATLLIIDKEDDEDADSN